MTFPTLLNLTITLDGVDVSDYVQPDSLQITNVLTSQVDTCRLVLEDAGVLSPSTWKELIILDGATRLFAGYVLSVDERPGPDLGINYEISASDYALRLDKVVVKKQYEGMTDKAILADLFSTYVPGESYDAATNVTAIKTHARIRFNRMTLLECIQKLASLASADWYVDENKTLWFFETTTGSASVAPFSLSDDPDKIASMPYYDAQIMRDGAGVVNRVEILGGNYRSDDTTFYLKGTGEDKRIILPFKLHAPEGETSILVYRNSGTLASPVWVQMTVKVGYIDQLSGANDVLYYYQDKVIERQSNWPNLENAVKIVAKYEVPLRARVQDAASIAHYGLILDDVIVDEEIVDKPVARVAGQARLASSAMEKTAITLSCDEPGLRAGQKVRFVNATHGLDADYLVRRVTARVGVNGRAVFGVQLGTYNPDLIDMMLLLARQAKPKIPWRDDEVLDELLQIAEEITLDETTAVSSSTGPYFFDATQPYAMDWGFGVFSPKFYTLLDEFTTDQAAPLTSPRTCEPGPGTLTIVDTGNNLSISGGKAVSSARVSNSDPTVKTEEFQTSPGRAVYFRFTPDSGESFVGYRATNIAADIVQYGLQFSLSGGATSYLAYFYKATGRSTGDTYTYGQDYEILVVFRDIGFFIFIRGGSEFSTWTLFFVDGSVASSSQATGRINMSDTNLDTLALLDFYGDFLTDYGAATYHDASPASGDTGTMDADGFVEITWTPQAGETLNMYIRRTDDSNAIIIRCAQAGGTIKTIKVEAGVETELDSDPQTWNVGTTYNIRARAVGNSLRSFVDSVAKNVVTSTFNQTATGLKVTGFTTAANLAAFPRTPNATIQQEINEHIPG